MTSTAVGQHAPAIDGFDGVVILKSWMRAGKVGMAELDAEYALSLITMLWMCESYFAHCVINAKRITRKNAIYYKIERMFDVTKNKGALTGC